MFHALRHTHASALIAKGHHVVQIFRRLGHGSPVITLRTYAHLFRAVDSASALAIESMFRNRIRRCGANPGPIIGLFPRSDLLRC